MNHRHRLALALLVVTGLIFAGCGAASTSSTSSTTATGASASTSDILRIPYLADMSVPDPDIFYDIEGNSVILSAYEGLLTYAPASTKLIGALATSWTVSPDRLTYTFQIRAGVHFHDGSALTSQAVKRSFERRLAVGQAPAYMLKPVASMSTPTPLTLVVKLKHPVNPFLDYLASSWGPKIIGPEAIVKHAGSDEGQKWLQTHDDGTGPFRLTAFERGRQYVLTRSSDYWGAKPFFKEVLIKITPDIGTQQLELKNGGVDAILHSFPASELSSLPSNVRVEEYTSFLRLLLYVNTQQAAVQRPRRARCAARHDRHPPARKRGLLGNRHALDRRLSGRAAAEPAGAATTPPTPARRPAGVKAASTKNITLGYTADESGVQRRVGELLQADLEAAGWTVTVKEVQLPQVYGYINDLKRRRTCCCRRTHRTPPTPTRGRGSSSTRLGA